MCYFCPSFPDSLFPFHRQNGVHLISDETAYRLILRGTLSSGISLQHAKRIQPAEGTIQQSSLLATPTDLGANSSELWDRLTSGWKPWVHRRDTRVGPGSLTHRRQALHKWFLGTSRDVPFLGSQ